MEIKPEIPSMSPFAIPNRNFFTNIYKLTNNIHFTIEIIKVINNTSVRTKKVVLQEIIIFLRIYNFVNKIT